MNVTLFLLCFWSPPTHQGSICLFSCFRGAEQPVERAASKSCFLENISLLPLPEMTLCEQRE